MGEGRPDQTNSEGNKGTYATYWILKNVKGPLGQRNVDLTVPVFGATSELQAVEMATLAVKGQLPNCTVEFRKCIYAGLWDGWVPRRYRGGNDPCL